MIHSGRHAERVCQLRIRDVPYEIWSCLSCCTPSKSGDRRRGVVFLFCKQILMKGLDVREVDADAEFKRRLYMCSVILSTKLSHDTFQGMNVIVPQP